MESVQNSLNTNDMIFEEFIIGYITSESCDKPTSFIEQVTMDSACEYYDATTVHLATMLFVVRVPRL